jgi:hypothetical protein
MFNFTYAIIGILIGMVVEPVETTLRKVDFN